jgi:hypothetical protein
MCAHREHAIARGFDTYGGRAMMYGDTRLFCVSTHGGAANEMHKLRDTYHGIGVAGQHDEDQSTASYHGRHIASMVCAKIEEKEVTARQKDAERQRQKR